MCLTIVNDTKEKIKATQFIDTAGAVQPICFTVDVGKQESYLVGLATAWDVVGQSSGRVFYSKAAPSEAQARLVANAYLPRDMLNCGRKKVSSIGFFAAAGLLIVVGIASFFLLRVKMEDTPQFKSCLKTLNAEQCKNMDIKVPKGGRAILVVCIILAILVILVWFFLLGPLGRIVAKEPKKPISCQQCYDRGPGWRYVMPAEEDGVSGFRLWLRKVRCRMGGDAGPCMCTNPDDIDACAKVSFDPAAPKNLQWQFDIANTYMDTPPSPSPSPQNLKAQSDAVCACCTAPEGGKCFNVRVDDPLEFPCT